MRTKSTTEIKETHKEFTLEIPDVFQVTPDYTVNLPGKKKVLIFSAIIPKRRITSTKDGSTAYIDEDHPGWKLRIVNSDGSPVSDNYVREAYDLTDPAEVGLTLARLAKQLTPKKRVVRHEDENFDD